VQWWRRELSVVFCPKCKSLMNVVRKDGKVILKCPKCGYEMEPKGKGRIVRTVEKEKHVPTTSKVVEVKEDRKALTEEEKEMLQDYYRDIFLENFSGE
jgi:DNA-directed RNA polymerase subunit M